MSVRIIQYYMNILTLDIKITFDDFLSATPKYYRMWEKIYKIFVSIKNSKNHNKMILSKNIDSKMAGL